MNDMAFGGGTEMIRDGDTTGHWDMVEAGMRYRSPFPFTLWSVSETFVQDFCSCWTLALACTVDYVGSR
jgi:hypothetical protein